MRALLIIPEVGFFAHKHSLIACCRTLPQCSHPSLTEHLSLASLQRIAAEDTKTRFALFYSRSTFDAPSLVPAKVEEGGGAWWIRANQGHSLALSGMEESMRKVETAEQAGLAVHGTTLDKWPLIREFQGGVAPSC